MTNIQDMTVARRAVLKGGGALVIGYALPVSMVSEASAAVAQARPLSPVLLDTYLSIAQDNSITAYFGKMDMGQGLDVAIGQIVAEELDVPFERVTIVMGDTALCVDQGGGSASAGIQRAGKPMRNAAAEARRVLVDLAAKKFKVASSGLQVSDGMISVANNPSKKAS